MSASMSVLCSRKVAPQNMSQYGEIYMDSNGYCVFVCTVCLKTAVCCEVCFKTFDLASFLEHIKNVHITEATPQQSGDDESLMNKAMAQHLEIINCDEDNNNHTFPGGNILKTQYQPSVGDDNDKSCEEGEILYQEIGEHIMLPETIYDDFGVDLTKSPSLIMQLSNEPEKVSGDCNLMANESSTISLKSAFISICPTCKKSFTSTEQFYTHLRMRMHSVAKMRPFKCQACSRSTASELAMRRHQFRFHSNESPTGAATGRICHKVVSQYHLKKYLAAHSTTTRIFKCQLCHRSYRNNWNLSAHIHNVHPRATMD